MRKPLIALIVAAVVGTSILVLDLTGVLFGGEDWQYGEPEMRAAIEGTWELTIADRDGTKKSWKLDIRQSDKADRAERAGIVKSAAACGDRTFVRSAHACGVMSMMPIEITSLEDPTRQPFRGRFFVPGPVFTRGQLDITVGPNEDYRKEIASASATIDPRGKVLKVSAGRPMEIERLPATLVRTRAPQTELRAPR